MPRIEAPAAQDPAAPTAPSPIARTDAIVDAWFNDTMRDSPASRSTEVWNHIHAAKEDLKRRLAQEI